MKTMVCTTCCGRKVVGIFKSKCLICGGTGSLPDLELSPHFLLSEFVHSDIAMRKGIDNTPDKGQILNLVSVAQTLELVRAQFGGIHINSGYRSVKTNAAIGGSSKTSAHTLALAADFVPTNRKISLKEITDWIIASNLIYDQVIYEKTWIHLGVKNSNGETRKEKLMMFGNKYFIYDPTDPRVC